MASLPLQTNILSASGIFDPAQPSTELHLADGRIFRVDTQAFASLDHGNSPKMAGSGGSLSEQVVIPLVEERITIEKRVVETGKVRLHKTLQEYTETLDEPLAVDTYDVERVILNREIDARPAVRQEGDTIIYPLVEERLVLTKSLILA